MTAAQTPPMRELPHGNDVEARQLFNPIFEYGRRRSSGMRSLAVPLIECYVQQPRTPPIMHGSIPTLSAVRHDFPGSARATYLQETGHEVVWYLT